MRSMPIGILCGCGAVFAGGLVGTVMGKYFDDETKDVLTTVFGLAAISAACWVFWRAVLIDSFL